jgi:SPOR domain
MSMADDSRLRSYRSNDPYRRAAEPAPPSEKANARDPLAELARLLGQSDPFAELGRRNRAPRQTHDAPPTAPGDWQAAPARDVDASDSRSRWAPPSQQDYTRASAPQSRPAPSRYYDEPQVNAEPHGAYGDDGGQEHQQDHYDQDDGALEPHDEATYDDPPRVRRGSALPTALALIACAMVGTAGASAFRSYYGNGGATQTPPVITADASSPTKIVPASDPQSGNAGQDRPASADKEQIISSQEEPAALKDPANQAAPRVVLPAPVAPAQGAAPSAGASNEPKKVRTVAIRPDGGGDASGKPVSGQAAPSANAAPAAPKAAPALSSGPISLDPQSEQVAAPANQTRTAAAPPAATRAAPDATESTSDGFMVQLSSQKTEADAQLSFRSLQARFPNELSGLQPIVRRADLGSKGVFYRTMVGPFASAHEASQFCANYKAAGGQCVVPSN